MMFVRMFLMLFGIGKNIFLTYLMLKISMKNIPINVSFLDSFKLPTKVFNNDTNKILTIPIYSNTLNISWQEKKHTTEKCIDDISTTNKWIKVIYTANRWNIMTSSVEKRNKGKAPA